MKVIIGNYFPAGQLLGLTDASESDMIQKAENDLEGAYTVKVGQLSDMKDSEGIEFVTAKKFDNESRLFSEAFPGSYVFFTVLGESAAASRGFRS